MRYNAVLASALYSSATLLGHVRAQDAEDVAASSSVSSPPVEKPTFTVRQPSTSHCLFQELCKAGQALSPKPDVLTCHAAFQHQGTLL